MKRARLEIAVDDPHQDALGWSTCMATQGNPYRHTREEVTNMAAHCQAWRVGGEEAERSAQLPFKAVPLFSHTIYPTVSLSTALFASSPVPDFL